jgi:hypothetical protein
VDRFARFLPNNLGIRFDVPGTGTHRAQLPMRVVGIQCVFCCEDEVAAVLCRQFKFLRDSDGFVGRGFGA